MNLLSTRRWWVLGTAAVFAAGGAVAACSSGGDDADSGSDSGGGESTTDSPSGDGGGNDAGNDVTPVTCEAGVFGTCDIVAQNCPSGQECVTYQDAGAWALHCVNAKGSTPEGYTCTPSAQNPCTAGLECVNNVCSKHCCLGDDAVCGKSPMGYQGACDLEITLTGNVPAYSVCDYATPCQPFGIQPCASGQTCLVKDMSGSAKCSNLNPPPGKPEKTQCMFANDCASGLGCYGAPDGGGFTCQWNCYLGGGPFDAGIEKAEAGHGGCPVGETCSGTVTGLPTWFGLCH